MTEQEAIDLLKIQQKNHNTEEAHAEADDILCIFLKGLGYIKLIEEYQAIDKWYA